jgi:hypothetical protein
MYQDNRNKFIDEYLQTLTHGTILGRSSAIATVTPSAIIVVPASDQTSRSVEVPWEYCREFYCDQLQFREEGRLTSAGDYYIQRWHLQTKDPPVLTKTSSYRD